MTTRFKPGQKPWNVGKPMSEDAKDKIRKKRAGMPPWNKGLKTGPLSEDHKRKCSESGKQKIFTEEHKKNISKSLKGRKAPWVKIPNCGQGKPSSLGFKLAEILFNCGFENIAVEESFYPFRVDVVLADEWLGFEADGKYWHNRSWIEKSGRKPNRFSAKERDEQILKIYGLPIIHIDEDEINHLYKILGGI